MPDELSTAEIQQAFLEYRSNFKEPAADFWYGGRQGEIIRAMYAALSPWHLGLENITWNQTAKNVAEVQLTFGLPSILVGIQVGISGVTMNAFNPDWSRAAASFLVSSRARRIGGKHRPGSSDPADDSGAAREARCQAFSGHPCPIC